MIFEKKIHRVKWEEAPEEIRAPIRRRQAELIEAVTDGPTELVRYLRSRLALESAEKIEAPPFPRRELTPSEYKDPPVELEEELGAAWKDVLEHRARARVEPPVLAPLPHRVDRRWPARCRRSGARGSTAVWSREERASHQELPSAYRGSAARPWQHVRVLRLPVGASLVALPLADEVNRTTEGRIETGAAHWLFHLHRLELGDVGHAVPEEGDDHQPTECPGGHRVSPWERVRTNGRFDQKDVEAIATGLARVSLRRSLDHTPLDELYEMAVAG